MSEHATRTDRPTRNGRRARDADDGSTLGDCDHTHPYTGESFGDAMVYRRGPVVAADGGAAEAVESAASSADDGEPGARDADRGATGAATDTLSDVDHTPPQGAEDANRVHERGGEHGGETSEAV